MQSFPKSINANVTREKEEEKKTSPEFELGPLNPISASITVTIFSHRWSSLSDSFLNLKVSEEFVGFILIGPDILNTIALRDRVIYFDFFVYFRKKYCVIPCFKIHQFRIDSLFCCSSSAINKYLFIYISFHFFLSHEALFYIIFFHIFQHFDDIFSYSPLFFFFAFISFMFFLSSISFISLFAITLK